MNSGSLRHSSRLDAAAGGDIGRHATRAGAVGNLPYQALAELNCPTDTQQLQAEIARLASTGLKAVDIATALRMNLAQVRNMLGDRTG